MTLRGSLLIDTVTSPDPSVRNRSVRDLIAGASTEEILRACEDLETFRQSAENLYERVRASMFLHAIYRYALQDGVGLRETGSIPFEGFKDLMERRFEQAIASFRGSMDCEGPNGAIASALAQAYERITYQTLADQVRRSVRSCRGNRWMFRVGQADEQPLRLHPRLLERGSDQSLFPILVERTPVRLDLSHSAWSDIFFLGMDYPEGARVLNISVDLGVHGRDEHPRPPIETYVRAIPEPLLRLTSIDLNACKDVTTLDELFNFGNDYLGLIKAGVIASGLVPPSFEGTANRLDELLGHVVRPGYGLEVVSKVNDIPKGSRLAVSTNLLASLISLLMRATGQTRSLTGSLEPEEARVVVARAILGEWLGGSGGGWQDSGGTFPGVKVIHGVAASESDPEKGVSRGRLLPEYELLDGRVGDSALTQFQEALAESLVLVHGGMAQNVGPILNMVTEKYLLRSGEEWEARQEALEIFEAIVQAVKRADVQAVGALTTRNWEGPLKRIIPWVSNQFTETIIREAKEALGDDFWGFLMLGGMSGGGMGFFVAPHRQASFRGEIAAIMARAKAALDDAMPFAMEPVVYGFRVNPFGTFAELQCGKAAMMPSRYYTLQVPRMIAEGTEALDPLRMSDVDHFANKSRDTGELLRVFRTMINNLFPVTHAAADPTSTSWNQDSDRIRSENGFDPVQHAQLREDLQRGRIGLALNRLPVATDIRDVEDSDLLFARAELTAPEVIRNGVNAIRRGEVAVVTLAAGVGSRWTTGAGVVKAINPFVMLAGRHRSFLELHLAKTRKAQQRFEVTVPHVVTTSYLTHAAIERHLNRSSNYGHDGPVYLSRGQSIGQRLIPMDRDLSFLWEEGAHETLDENKQKVRDASRRAILDWARGRGEGTDYVDNVPIQRFNPPGHFYEVPNLLRNGVLARLIAEHPNLNWLMVHNIDTLGVDLDPTALGLAIESRATLGFEVIARRIDDRGGGLARVGGRLRLLEGLAQPREDTEFALRYYSTNTSWVHVDALLEAFQLTRSDLSSNPAKVAAAVRAMAARLPTYVTIKDVKRRWGHGQEDVFPVAQFEKLWGDMTSLPDLPCSFLAVDRQRGQQLKDTAQLDGWENDGSREYVQSICDFGS
ncbi:UTP--glucose-1-phosphate uridylyltransferase [Singulisphaera acidiphila]|uniref:UDP-glucose pyrophosphorylase n=1 Tax=Singulisphaera acidiphila (strain ATCC BAA-1392 / DSM 18658 / VKM B-2454 / MOB10) TaxID=886293 RepID=L0DEQ6_SINAD|nr:UTP--glucose-1-phosphate uridylyltransferase [Singulisphaera acidiphila]AGA27151.1 UDP-glucose pyrophosphorylase [Singulisphaera acidiphila DSM 18658]